MCVFSEISLRACTCVLCMCVCMWVCALYACQSVYVFFITTMASCSAMDGCGRLWDLRSGKCILLMDGHQNGVLGVDFSPNG